MKYVKHNNSWSLTPDARMDVRDELPPGNYTVCRNPVTGEYYLEESEPFTLPSKCYGKTAQWSNRILDAFRKEEHQTGVLLAGTKGSGKTLLSKHISVMSGLPVLIVNTPFSDERFMRTIQGISQQAVILFDEFEKLYDKEAQERVLTLFDGVYSARNKIMILTCNDRNSVRDFFHNRPGRLRYSIEFKGLGAEFIKEYCADTLVNHEHLDDIIKTAVGCAEFNFDMLQALVRELNQYGGTVEDTLEILNVKPYIINSEKWLMKITAPTQPNLKLSTRQTFSHPLNYFIRSGEGGVYELIMSVEGTFQDGTTPSDGKHYNQISLNDLKTVDPHTGTYLFEVEAEVEDTDGNAIKTPIRIFVSEQKSPSIYSGAWNVGGFDI
jgi:hypothetical protein